MIKIGIECESIEGPESWGVGRIVKKLLEEISRRPELAREFRFFLYFKSRVPDFKFLNNPLFIKKIVRLSFLPSSFSLYYYVLLPIRLWFERLNLMFFPNYMLPILFRGKSLAILTEDVYHEIRRSELRLRYKLAYKIFAGWWSARHATKIMAISETSKNELIKLFKINPNRIFVNTLGIDPPKLINSEQLTVNSNYVLYIGQAFPRRYLRETMLAFEKLTTLNTERLNLVEAQPLSNLKLIAIGKDKYNPQIIGDLVKKINGRLGRDAIIWKEYVSEDELATLYANAKCVVYVSSREAFGLPPLEALSYGVPAVVADQPITREIFGDNAFFACPVRDRSSEMTASSNGVGDYTPECIASAIKKALTNEAKRQEIIANASQILQKYTWREFANRFLDFVKIN